MRMAGLSCNLQINYTDSEGERKLNVSLPGLPEDHVLRMSKDTVLNMIREVYGDVPADVTRGVNAVTISYFKSLSEKLIGALPTSIVLASEWP